MRCTLCRSPRSGSFASQIFCSSSTVDLGPYSSSLSTWRRQREAADLAALAPQRRGPKVDAAARVDALHIAQLTRERDKLRVELDKAQLVIEVQKKVAALLGLLAADDKRGNT